jgi:periplasmic protein TonB
MRAAVDENRVRLHDYFWRMYEVEVEKPKDEPPPEPPPPEPEPEPAPAPKAQAKPVQDDDPYKNLPPPTPAKAAPVLTRDAKADDPPELPGFVTGDGSATYGMQSAAGNGDNPTMQRNASLEGKPGGKGKAGPVQAAPPAEDRSRAVGLAGGTSWSCPFPPEADTDQIDQATVGVQVTVRPDGSAQSAAVVSDPGHGFGRAARQCALARHYQPALDRSGTAILSSGLVNVRFNR